MIFLKKKEVKDLLKEIKEIKEKLNTLLDAPRSTLEIPQITVTEPNNFDDSILKDIKEKLDQLCQPTCTFDTSKLNISVLLPDEKLIAMSNNMALMIIDKIKGVTPPYDEALPSSSQLKEQNDLLQKKIDELTKNLNHQTEKISVLTSTIDSFYFENELVKKQLTIEEDLRNCYQEIESIRDTLTTL